MIHLPEVMADLICQLLETARNRCLGIRGLDSLQRDFK